MQDSHSPSMPDFQYQELVAPAHKDKEIDWQDL